MTKKYFSTIQLLNKLLFIGLICKICIVNSQKNNFRPINESLKLVCNNYQTNLGMRFHKNEQIISTSLTFNNGTYYLYTIESEETPDTLEYILEKNQLRLDDDESIYKAFNPNNLNVISCSFNVYLCANKREFRSSLQVGIDGVNNTDIIIDDPLNFRINYYYKIDALPLKPSIIEFCIDDNNKTCFKERINKDCTATTDSGLKCYTNESSFNIIHTCPGKTIKARVYNEEISIDNFEGVCELDLDFYNPQPLSLNIQYNIANFTLNNTNDELTLNDTLRIDFHVICANPNVFNYSLNIITCNNVGCSWNYLNLLDNTNSESFSYDYTIKDAFNNIAFEYCVDNGVKRICGTSSYTYKEPDPEPTIPYTIEPITNTSVTPTVQTDSSIISSTTLATITTIATTITQIIGPTESLIAYYWVWLIIGIASGIILCVVVFSLIIFYRKRKQRRDYGENIYDKPEHKESVYNSASKKETNF